MAGSIPSRRASLPGATGAGKAAATGHAGGLLPTGNATDDQPRPGGGGMPDLPPVISHGAISPPGGMPTITLVKPSYKEACDARDASRTRFESHPPGSDVRQGTVRSDTNHLGQTVATVRNYLNATIAASDSEIESLNTAFQSAAVNGSDIEAPLQKLETILNKTDQMIATMKADNPADPSIDNASELIREAKSQLVEAQDPHTDTSQRCHTALNVLRSLDEGRTVVFNRLEYHMQEAETTHSQMKTAIIDKPANLLFEESAPILRCLDHVLQNGDGAPTGSFDMDGFIQLLYSKKALGVTIAAVGNRHMDSAIDIESFLAAIKTTGDTGALHDLSTKLSQTMFTEPADTPINFGSYIRNVWEQAANNPTIPNAAELLKEALKYLHQTNIASE